MIANPQTHAKQLPLGIAWFERTPHSMGRLHPGGPVGPTHRDALVV